jgi:hypothetical protein
VKQIMNGSGLRRQLLDTEFGCRCCQSGSCWGGDGAAPATLTLEMCAAASSWFALALFCMLGAAGLVLTLSWRVGNDSYRVATGFAIVE